MPSEGAEGIVGRHKSKLHHTAGFETVEDARAFASGEMATHIRAYFYTSALRLDTVGAMTWAPSEVPAAVRWMEREQDDVTSGSG